MDSLSPEDLQRTMKLHWGGPDKIVLVSENLVISQTRKSVADPIALLALTLTFSFIELVLTRSHVQTVQLVCRRLAIDPFIEEENPTLALGEWQREIAREVAPSVDFFIKSPAQVAARDFASLHSDSITSAARCASASGTFSSVVRRCHL